MGKQKQQRRSAKKKGGKKGEAGGASQNNCGEDDSVTVKCTACAKLVKPEDAIACPVPGCDRIFCTKRCSSSCLVQCADPLCPRPNRCRPCASGRTLALLVTRNESLEPESQTPITDMHNGYANCDACPNKVCCRCNYFNNCSKCHKRVCLGCVDSDRCILNFCGGPCNAVYCDQCDDGFDINTNRCTECTVESQFLSEGGELEIDDAGQAKLCWDKRKEMVDEVVLEYAEDIKLAMAGIALFSSAGMDRDYLRLGSISTDGEGSGAGTLSRETMQLVARIVRPSRDVSETTPQRVKCILRMFSDKEWQLRRQCDTLTAKLSRNDHHAAAAKFRLRRSQLLTQIVDLRRGIVAALAPDVKTMLEAFHSMEGHVSGNAALSKLQGMHLDVMQELYQRELCGHCLRHTPDGDSTKRCGGCSAIRYCSGRCQALSWPVHRHHCRRMGVVRRRYNQRLLEKKHEYVDEMATEQPERTGTLVEGTSCVLM